MPESRRNFVYEWCNARRSSQCLVLQDHMSICTNQKTSSANREGVLEADRKHREPQVKTQLISVLKSQRLKQQAYRDPKETI